MTQQLPDMTMPHLADEANLDDLKSAMEQKDAPSDDVLSDPKMQEEYTFAFSWKAPNGKEFTGTFTTKILSIAERQNMGALRAHFSNGMAYQALDPLTNEINMILAHLAYALVKKPSWANDLRQYPYPELLQSLYDEVASHEATFLGWGQNAADGENAG